MFTFHNRYYAIFLYYCIVTLNLIIMSKLSLNGVNLLVSLLFCDPAKPIYEITGRQDIPELGVHSVSTFSNFVNVPETIMDVNIQKLNRLQIGTYLNQLTTRFDCSSFVPYILFRARLAEYDESLKKEKEDVSEK